MGPDPQRKDAGRAREWIIAIVVVATLMLSCGTMLGYTTWYLSTDIEGVREAGMKANSDVLSRLALDEGRIGYLERSSDEHYTDEAAFRSKVAAQLDSDARPTSLALAPISKWVSPAKKTCGHDEDAAHLGRHARVRQLLICASAGHRAAAANHRRSYLREPAAKACRHHTIDRSAEASRQGR